jgi:hypothetical protein
MARYVRGVYERVCDLNDRGVPLRDEEVWDMSYSTGSFGTELCEESGLLLRTQIELRINGQQLLETGWEWQESSMWAVDLSANSCECDKDGWSYAADWNSCFYARQDDVIWK